MQHDPIVGRRFRPRIEALESRDLLYAGLSIVLDGTTLKVTGTDAADFIFVYQQNNRLNIYGRSESFDAAQVSAIAIDGGAGDDQIRVDSQIVSGWQPIYKAVSINGGDGNDIIFGSAGDDMLFGGAGEDLIWGGAGNDYLDGGLGVDYLFGDAGNDTLAGDKGNDILLAGAGDDVLLGGDGSDYLAGGAGNDYLDGGRDYDWLIGEEGSNVYYDDTPANANYFAASSTNITINGHFGWFDTTITNDGLRSIGRAGYRDWSIGRDDMIRLFAQASTDGTVDATELSDLRLIISSNAALQTPDYVANLAGKVVNSNSGNALYQGAALGNLASGSSGLHITLLVNKWFLGADRPNSTLGGATYAYQYAAGNLFVGGISFVDIRQGYLGDCYLLAGLAETAYRAPGVIQDMFIDNGDGTFTVRLFNNGEADFVTVDRYLPTDRYGRLVFANMGAYANSAGNELWVALAEKAYAQMNGSGWMRAGGVNSYNSIAAGYIADALKQINGRATSVGNSLNFNALVSAFNSGALIGLASKFSGSVMAGVVTGHAYAVVGYDATTQKFTLFNPWGMNNGSVPGTLTLTFDQIRGNFSYFDRTTA